MMRYWGMGLLALLLLAVLLGTRWPRSAPAPEVVPAVAYRPLSQAAPLVITPRLHIGYGENSHKVSAGYAVTIENGGPAPLRGLQVRIYLPEPLWSQGYQYIGTGVGRDPSRMDLERGAGHTFPWGLQLTVADLADHVALERQARVPMQMIFTWEGGRRELVVAPEDWGVSLDLD